MISVPLVLPWPNDAQLLEADDVLVIAKDAEFEGDASPFMTVSRLRSSIGREGDDDCRLNREKLATALTASFDTVLCYAVEFARMKGIEVVYDATSAR